MSDTWEEALFKNMLNLIFFAVCCAIGWLVLSLLSLALWANVAAMITAISLIGALGCYLGIVAIQKWEYSYHWRYWRFLSIIRKLRSSLKFRK
ncbi:hypothetical protein KJA15_02975 [Patescibacteria group bacterium]|nr:hypothetical protein [Patescibacteria group bacterium]